jgi:hypothetical protein
MRKRCKFCGKILYNNDDYKRVKTPVHHLGFEPVCPDCFVAHGKEVEEFDPMACSECGNDVGTSRYIKEIAKGPDMATNVYVKICQDCLANFLVKDFIHDKFLMRENEVADIDALLLKKKHVIGKLEMAARHVEKAFPGRHLCLSIDGKKENIMIFNDATDDTEFREITDFLKYVMEHAEITSDGMTPVEMNDKCEGCPKQDTCPDAITKMPRRT